MSNLCGEAKKLKEKFLSFHITHVLRVSTDSSASVLVPDGTSGFVLNYIWLFSSTGFDSYNGTEFVLYCILQLLGADSKVLNLRCLSPFNNIIKD